MIGLLFEVGATRRTSLPPGWAGLEGPRVEEWEWRLLDDRDAVLDVLGAADVDHPHGVTSASLDFNVATDTRGKGQLDWSGPPGKEPDWVSRRVQPWYRASFPDGSRVEWPMGVFLPSTDGGTFDDGLKRASLDLYDKTLILRRDEIESTFGLPAGTPVVPAVRELITGAGGGRHSIDDSGETLRAAMVWEVGTSKLRIVNDLLDAVGYFAVWTDGLGVFRSSRYVPPASRPVDWAFRSGPRSVHGRGLDRRLDWFDTPNKIIGISTADGESEALRAVATNTDPTDPLSYRAPGAPAGHKGRPFWKSETRDGIEATSQEVLQAHVDRLLASARQTSAKVQLRHPMLPLTVNGRVSLSSAAAGLSDTAAVVQAVSIVCSPGAKCSTTLQEVRL